MTALPTSSRSADPLAFYPHFRAGADGLTLATPAKLNLFLEIVRKRPDGYHDLESLMVAVELYDTLELRAVPGGAVELRCEPDTLGSGPDNLVHKAAAALRAVAGRPDLGAHIRLTKRIPTQAGMGGGSSDAAAALVGLNEIWKLGLTREQLVAIAASIGSDVAFFLALPAAWCTGRGEITAPEPPPRRALDFVLVLPPVGVSTPAVFKRLVVPVGPVGGDRLRAAFRAGDPAAVGAALFNRLEPAAFGAEPLVGRLRTRLAELHPAPCGALMSGSGSTVFAVCRDRSHALEVAAAFRNSRPADEPESRVLIVRGVAL
ncbi:4-diphosphocytidyl-2-C-methyl-D-erythritol kinase [Gemmata obscuriglobus]|nr:4-(cytidine 5'-diphospho)-2-C-methyl-D-erythritol kinase [Gemmata obscuriglobus]QEG26792.1 4-diphosphocytidyl-2-C-methyl-D-erythritol kinase [Gemmata obscuriglobus]VTS02666.1 4-diphosphocytidyl-2-c-methyl-d-erythritol kinase : 4-diphosphocytidyl-2-C-methyl-D-erythritol kinase OS=Singulisphaera acidiphila (strain ATCC BAA-1392 / DSM 18658 / VKM B-2454 / MOB10) GN=ispE PE=3 SV=1: GHMP_kinases_N: GHMP_kinases_C [Gemmata obscuriglobus UQM 2246]